MYIGLEGRGWYVQFGGPGRGSFRSLKKTIHLVSSPPFSLIAAINGRVIVTAALQNTIVGVVVLSVVAVPVLTMECTLDCAQIRCAAMRMNIAKMQGHLLRGVMMIPRVSVLK